MSLETQAMVKGRLPCIKLVFGALKDAIEPHVTVPLSHCMPYSQIRFRRRPKWMELFRVRQFAIDVLTASSGYCLTQTYLEGEVKPVALELLKKKTMTPGEEEQLEDLVYRMRAVMAHLRNARLHGHVPPKRFAALKAVIAIVQTGPPPSAVESPCKDKLRLKREEVFLMPRFGESSVVPAPASDSDDDVIDTTPEKHTSDAETIHSDCDEEYIYHQLQA